MAQAQAQVRGLALPGAARGGAALWALATLAMAIGPAFMEVAAAHQTHWAASLPGGYEPEWVASWAARTWSLVCALALGGWASTPAFADPRAARRLVQAWLGALVGVVVVAAAGVPGAVWIWRLDVVELTVMLGLGVVALVAPVIAAGVSASVAVFAPPFVAFVAGTAAAGGALFLFWGAF